MTPQEDGSATTRRLVVVHAHPDDECIFTGGILARYAAEGAQACLVTCTNGELGEVADVEGISDRDDVIARLGEVRVAELRASARALGLDDVRLLGYHDSGMAGTPGNDVPEAFVNQPFEEVVARLAAILREIRPQVVVTYNERGFYGHPDHIRAHEATVAAIDAAADAWTVPKLYYTAIPVSSMRAARERLRQADDPSGATASRFTEENVSDLGTPDTDVSAIVDVAAYVPHKLASLRAHLTQFGTTRMFLEMPEVVRTVFLSTEHYVLARGTRPATTERDLFEGTS